MADAPIYHFVYVTSCELTASYYIEVHSTKNLHDGYLGSGKRLGIRCENMEERITSCKS